MKHIVYILFMTVLTACVNSGQKQDEKERSNFLKGTLWTSDFYHYHNNYYFTTDSTGISQAGQYMWSMPVDPALYNNSEDSIGYDEDAPFKYLLKDTVLTIKYFSDKQDSLNDSRIFYLKRDDDKTIHFISDYEYSYGREYLQLRKKEINYNKSMNTVKMKCTMVSK